jgi:hypothetical protein
MTTVVNVKVGFIRPQYSNLEDWMKDTNNNVYIGRKGIVFINNVRFPKQDSIWCNPFKIDKNNNREQVLEKYEKYIIERLEKDDDLKEKLKELKGKQLGCWCCPEKCHGDILRKLIEK